MKKSSGVIRKLIPMNWRIIVYWIAVPVICLLALFIILYGVFYDTNAVGFCANFISVIAGAATMITAINVWFINNKIGEFKQSHWFELHLNKHISNLNRQLKIVERNIPENENNVRKASQKCHEICQIIKEKLVLNTKKVLLSWK